MRTLVGLVLVVGGVFGILPVLGFWMLPIGIGIIAMDVRMLIDAWHRRHRPRDRD